MAPEQPQKTRGYDHGSPIKQDRESELVYVASGLSSGLLNRSVSAPRQPHVHLAELRHFSNVGVERLLGVLSLDLKNLLDRLRANQLLVSTGGLLERSFGIIGEPASNSLEALMLSLPKTISARSDGEVRLAQH